MNNAELAQARQDYLDNVWEMVWQGPFLASPQPNDGRDSARYRASIEVRTALEKLGAVPHRFASKARAA